MAAVFKIFEGIDDVEVNSVETGIENFLQIGIFSAEDDVLPFGVPLGDLIISLPQRIFFFKPCGL